MDEAKLTTFLDKHNTFDMAKALLVFDDVVWILVTLLHVKRHENQRIRYKDHCVIDLSIF